MEAAAPRFEQREFNGVISTIHSDYFRERKIRETDY